MKDCHSECDCGWPGPDYGPGHEPDCHVWYVCDEGRWCDKHFEEEMKAHLYLKGLPRHMVYDDAEAREERNQELRDAGRGHLVRDE